MDAQVVNGFNGGDFGGGHMDSQASFKNSQPKALKFVTNYGAPHPKRRRIAAACLTCRKRKTACSGERPTCETCLQNRLECAGYAPDAPAPGYKRTSSEANITSDAPNGIHDVASNRGRQASRTNHVEQEQQQQQQHPGLRRGSNYGMAPPGQGGWSGQDAASVSNVQSSHGRQTSEGAMMEEAQKDSLFSGPRNRMPYFRWLGPTAVVPGFKQMVVKIKRQDSDMGRSSSDSVTAAANGVSPSMKSHTGSAGDQRRSTAYTAGSTNADQEMRSPLRLPFYDTSPMPPSELITHLARTFFNHLGCNYPFLQRERFMRDLEEKQVDAVLVDAVCALAARFSTHSLLVQQTSDDCQTPRAEYGHAFAQRAQTALVDSFACPTVAAVQAALLLAYNEFGENRDSGLWMYLGISIRMAQDLGLHKIEGLKYKGMDGPTPKLIKKENMGGSPGMTTKHSSSREGDEEDDDSISAARIRMARKASVALIDVKDHVEAVQNIDEQMAVEQGRVDTFWGLFFLDRVVSSSTGRRSTIRDNDIEISFPSMEQTDPKSPDWPAPYPALIRIIHLYGRVTDLLNSIKEPSDITSDTPRRLASMERQVTNFYQGLSPRLHFDAVNFQHYMKAGEGTNFVLLHFWFHTLIVLLHQPTLLKTFEGRMLQLFPNSQQLAMSSAKTIADILSYSQLMDAKASLGNPFTIQPIYIAACAFLRETVEQTATSRHQSRDSSPTRNGEVKDSSESRPTSSSKTKRKKRVPTSDFSSNSSRRSTSPDGQSPSSTIGERHESSEKSQHSELSGARTASALAKHTLLATAASQHYQLCYKALEAIYTYWAGAKYILTVLDQKFKGVRDPLLYTAEEGASAMERPRPEPAFTSPGWRRKNSWGPIMYGPNVPARADFWREKAPHMVGGSPADPSKAIGWTLTGTMNSPNTSLAWHYPSAANSSSPQQEQPRQQSRHHSTSPVMNQSMTAFAAASQHAQPRSMRAPEITRHPSSAALAISTSGASATYMSGMDSQYSGGNNAQHEHAFNVRSAMANGINHNAQQHPTFSPPGSTHSGQDTLNAWNYDMLWHSSENSGVQPFGELMIESQDIDMNLLGLEMPWFDGSHEYTEFFDGGNHQSPITPGVGGGGGGSTSAARRTAH